MKTNLLILLLIANTLSFAKSKQKENKPNVIIIFTDDQGYGDLGCYGAKMFTTPNLDKMAKEGVLFTDFYVAASVCSPSRAALLTGKYPIRTGMHKGVLFPHSEGGLEPNAVTIGEVLNDNGYQTACVGKWHLGHASSEYMPNKQGFDYYFGIPYSNDMDKRRYPRKKYIAPPLPLYENEKVVDQGMDQRYLTKRFTQKSIEFIRKNKTQPFFLYLAHAMPHTPVHVSPDFMHSSKYGRYGDAIQEIDWSVGEIFKTLEELEIKENTLVIFTSDNGPDQGHWMGENHGKATPLRGAKGSTWEGGMRVPCLAVWPKKIPKGTICAKLTTAMDIFPTICAITNSNVKKEMIFDGKNIFSSLTCPGLEHTSDKDVFFYYATNGKIEAVRQGNWKLHINKTKGWDKSSGKFKTCLFNLQENPEETVDVSQKCTEKVEELKKLIVSIGIISN